MPCSTHHQIEHTYTGPVDDELGDSMLACDQEVGLEEGREHAHTVHVHVLRASSFLGSTLKIEDERNLMYLFLIKFESSHCPTVSGSSDGACDQTLP